MIVEKYTRSKIEQPYFFIKGHIDNIDSEYFINAINEGIKHPNNLSYKLKVHGKLTPYEWFMRDPKFQQIFFEILNKLNNMKGLIQHSWSLQSVWGVREDFGDYTEEHNHISSLGSGCIYLNDVEDQPTIFPEIKESIEPRKGDFVLFSPFLNHKSKRIYTDQTKYLIAFNLKFAGENK